MQDIHLGDVTISAILEHQKTFWPAERFFLNCDAGIARQHLAEMEPFLYDAETGALAMAFQSFLIRTPKHIIMVDTCNGPDKFEDVINWDTKPWLDRFHQLGLTFEDVDFVLCTHLHTDHTGWNTRLENGKWVPTFPNATYLFEKHEYRYWQNIAETGNVPAMQRDGVWQTNCLPIAEAGQAELVEGSFIVDDYVSLVPAPGHSPGHYCVRISSGGRQAMVLGDAVHHKLQCREPSWSTPFCWDPEMAARSRVALLQEAAENDIILLPTHFPAPTAGRVSADGEHFCYHFLDD